MAFSATTRIQIPRRRSFHITFTTLPTSITTGRVGCTCVKAKTLLICRYLATVGGEFGTNQVMNAWFIIGLFRRAKQTPAIRTQYETSELSMLNETSAL